MKRYMGEGIWIRSNLYDVIYERLLNGGKMTGMDLLEFIDINGPDPMPKYGAIWAIGYKGWIPPPSLGLT